MIFLYSNLFPVWIISFLPHFLKKSPPILSLFLDELVILLTFFTDDLSLSEPPFFSWWVTPIPTSFFHPYWSCSYLDESLETGFTILAPLPGESGGTLLWLLKEKRNDPKRKDGELSTSEIIKTKMGNFPQARWSKPRWGTLHKRDDHNKIETFHKRDD
jgi:hypothetical protein